MLYRRLAVFAGPWALADAEAVCADASLPADAVLDLLTGLADHSLVAVLPGPLPTPDGQQRYRLLDTVRQHAAARLQAAGSEADATRPPCPGPAGAGRGRPAATGRCPQARCADSSGPGA